MLFERNTSVAEYTAVSAIAFGGMYASQRFDDMYRHPEKLERRVEESRSALARATTAYDAAQVDVERDRASLAATAGRGDAKLIQRFSGPDGIGISHLDNGEATPTRAKVVGRSYGSAHDADDAMRRMSRHGATAVIANDEVRVAVRLDAPLEPGARFASPGEIVRDLGNRRGLAAFRPRVSHHVDFEPTRAGVERVVTSSGRNVPVGPTSIERVALARQLDVVRAQSALSSAERTLAFARGGGAFTAMMATGLASAAAWAYIVGSAGAADDRL